MKKELYIIASGKVQGVFFRKTVQEHAHRDEIKGLVRNLADGSVEIYAQGSKAALDQFLQDVKNNPGYGVIEKMHIEELPALRAYEGFKIL